jgi:solute carrier family 39 (zinc transporter), member 1/2/3
MLWRDSIKIIILFALLLLTFTFSMLPLVVRTCANRALSSRRRRTCRVIISLLSCFAAGVFIGVCLLDLFPEVENSINKALAEAEITTSFPLPEFIVVLGFLLLLIVEQFVLTWKSDHSHHSHGPHVTDADSLQSSYNSMGRPRPPSPPVADLPEVLPRSFGSSENLTSEMENDTEAVDDANVEQAYTDPSSHSVIRSLILLVALSLHSLFEGLAVGLQETTDETVRLFFALLLHKCIVAFSVGLNMTMSKLSMRAIIASNVLFSIASPLGIAVGIGIMHGTAGLTEHAIIGTLNGLACGTFIYIVFFEILPHEFMKKHRHLYPDRMIKVFALLIGFCVVVGVVFLDPNA